MAAASGPATVCQVTSHGLEILESEFLARYSSSIKGPGVSTEIYGSSFKFLVGQGSARDCRSQSPLGGGGGTRPHDNISDISL